MSRARLALLGASALAVAAGCTSNTASTQGAQLSQPSAIAVFKGRTLHDPANLVPYLAIANANRNDLTLVDARTDTVVEAPLRLRPLAVPIPGRPALLASADLGDGMADLLVGVSAGDSVLQLVRTWAPDNDIVDKPPPDPDGNQSVDLAGEDILAVVALPAQPAGTARLVAALAGGRLAVVDYARSSSSEAIVKGAPVVQDVGFQALALATVPGDGAHVYAATLDPIGPGAIQGVAEIDVSAAPWPVRALDARGPTRLVAGTRLVERKRGALEPNEAAFEGQTAVTRVYAVLDETGCGPLRRIDCGLVALDPAKVPAAGDDHIPDDDWSQATGANVMPYRAPIRFEGARPVSIAIATPPAFRPTDATYPDGYMRLQLDADSPTVTTAVGVVATDAGRLEFLDLGRFRIASKTTVPVAAGVNATLRAFVDTGTEAEPNKKTQLWIRNRVDNAFAETKEAADLAVGITPGYTPDASWTVRYQGVLPGLEGRAAEAGVEAVGGDPWIAIQVGEGPRGAHVTSQVAKLYHPALGVAVGDIAVVKAAGIPGCVGTLAPGFTTATSNEFEVPITGFLPPAVGRPGGAVLLGPPPAAPAEWGTCFDSLKAAATAAFVASPSSLLPRLLVTIRSKDLLLVRNPSQYAGRPELSPDDPGLAKDYVLQYPGGAASDEDALAALCPLADWDGVFRPLAPPPTCDSAACRADCEKLVLARLARRVHHVSENCETAPGTTDQTCANRYAGQTFPFLSGPALTFRVGVEVETGTPTPDRRHSLTFGTQSGVSPLADAPDGTTVGANGALAFDPSTPDAPSAAYRFYVSYPGNQVVGVTPSESPIKRTTIR